MSFRLSNDLVQNVLLLIHTEKGAPLALRINVRKLYGVLTLLFVFVLTAMVGSLLFFREVELNRKLNERVLELEMRQQLAKSTEMILPTEPLGPRIAEEVSRRVSLLTPREVTRMPESVSKAPTEAPEDRVVAASSATPEEFTAIHTVPARIGELSVECVGEKCGVKLALLPTGTGVAQGHLLVILEVEVPRIGGSHPATNIRKRYIVYPGLSTLDELSADELVTMEKSPFRFSRVLSTSVDFNVGKLHRPLAVNLYLYDKDKNLIHHERKPVESAEGL